MKCTSIGRSTMLSWGPVCDLEGQVVGINIARAERIASYALPAGTVLPWLNELKSGQHEALPVGALGQGVVNTVDAR